MKKTLLALSIFCCLISCKKGTEVEPEIKLQSIILSQTSLDLSLGASTTLSVQFEPTNTIPGALTWSTSDATVIKLEGEGKLTALKLGESTITVKNSNGSVTAMCKVTVLPIEVTELVLDKTSSTMIVGTKDKLNVRIVPPDATNRKITWITSNPLVVKIDQEGNIEAISVGIASVTVKTDDGKTSNSCNITVVFPSLTGLDIDKKNLQLLVGEEVQLNAVTTPPNAQPEEMIWYSSDNSIATVSSTGLVKTIKPGDITIKVTNKAGNISSSSPLTVLSIKVQSIIVNNANLALTIGSSSKIIYSILPEKATDKTVLFNSSNSVIAQVDASGNVTAVSAGEAVITISSKDGGTNSKITVIVTPIKVSNVSFNKSSISLIVGESDLITATVLPLNAADKTITWSSSNSSVATVNQTGNINAINLGSATITATTKDGSFNANCSVIVSTID